MPYIDYKTEDTWQKRLFDKLISVEDKLDRLLVLQDQSVDTTVHPWKSHTNLTHPGKVF